MQADINTLTSTRVPRSLTELITLGRTLKRRAGDTPGLLRPPPHHRRPHPSHQRPPRTPTQIRTRTCETSPTTSPENSSKQEDSNPNYTPNYEEPVNLRSKGAQTSTCLANDATPELPSPVRQVVAILSAIYPHAAGIVGGFATIGGFCRRVAGVSGVYGRKTPR